MYCVSEERFSHCRRKERSGGVGLCTACAKEQAHHIITPRTCRSLIERTISRCDSSYGMKSLVSILVNMRPMAGSACEMLMVDMYSKDQ
jgi:hypothetical protein